MEPQPIRRSRQSVCLDLLKDGGSIINIIMITFLFHNINFHTFSNTKRSFCGRSRRRYRHSVTIHWEGTASVCMGRSLPIAIVSLGTLQDHVFFRFVLLLTTAIVYLLPVSLPIADDCSTLFPRSSRCAADGCSSVLPLSLRYAACFAITPPSITVNESNSKTERVRYLT